MEALSNISIFIVLSLVAVCYSREPWFFRGRPRDGFLGNPPVTEKTPKNLPPEMWVTQRQDHFNDANTKTWQQKYYVNDQYYKKGGPVFLMLGGEGPLGPTWMAEGAWIEYAMAYNAMLFSIEHRYYGKSHPTFDMSTENLQYLSSEQALADSAYFIQYCKNKFDLPDNKWISFGGSYSGSLSAWLRLKYPHLIDGAVATSAPLLAVIDFKEYLAVTKASLGTTGSECNEGIQEATTTVEKLLQTEEGREQIKKMFKLCDDIDIENKLDIANLFSNLANNFEGVVQYNKDNRAFEGGVGANITIDVLCNIMTDTSRGSTLQRYADVNSLMLSTYSEKCLDFLYYNMIQEMRVSDWNKTDSPGGRQWVYQTCTEFGFFQTSDLMEQPFGQGFPLSFWVQQCQDIYGYGFNAELINAGINRTNTNYGAKNIKASNIVFPNGSIDQWHALGKLSNLPAGSTAIFINGTAHCANMYPAADTDIPELTQARMTIQKLIGEWIH